MLRVGKCHYRTDGITYPSFPNFTNIIVLTKGHSKWYPLSPYFLKDSKGRIMENVWQFSKVYEKVPFTTQKKSRYDSTIIWQHPEEVHFMDGKLTPEYFEWRHKGMYAKEAIRYPVGYKHRHKCLFTLKEDENGVIDVDRKLDYVQARKEIYMPLYCNLVKKEKKFKELKERLRKGENLLIIEVDGPHQESLDYYIEKYRVSEDFIQNDTMIASNENIDIMLNDPKHPFGHGYCLCYALNNDL